MEQGTYAFYWIATMFHIDWYLILWKMCLCYQSWTYKAILPLPPKAWCVIKWQSFVVELNFLYGLCLSEDSVMYGFLDGPHGVFSGNFVIITDEIMDGFRNTGVSSHVSALFSKQMQHKSMFNVLMYCAKFKIDHELRSNTTWDWLVMRCVSSWPTCNSDHTRWFRHAGQWASQNWDRGDSFNCVAVWFLCILWCFQMLF